MFTWCEDGIRDLEVHQKDKKYWSMKYGRMLTDHHQILALGATVNELINYKRVKYHIQNSIDLQQIFSGVHLWF